MTIERLLLCASLALALAPGCGGNEFSSAPEAPAPEAGLDALPDATPEAGQEAETKAEAGPELQPEAGSEVEAAVEAGEEPEVELQPEAGPEPTPEASTDVEAGPEPTAEASNDALADALTEEAAWDATDFDAFTDSGQACITGVDLPYCTNGSEYPWLVPLICSNNAWKPNAIEGQCNYGCDLNGECNCTAPAGRLLANIIAGPPQQRYITDTLTGYVWFHQSGWTGTAAQAEAFCAAVPGGGYRLPSLDEAKTLMAQKLDTPYINSSQPPDINCKNKNADLVIPAGVYWHKGLIDDLHGQGYGPYNPRVPYWSPPGASPSGTASVLCIKAGDCFQGATRCAGDNTETCDASGHWQPAEVCSLGCLNGVCKCQLGEFRCSGTNPCEGYNCTANGSWSALETVCFNVGHGCNPSTNQCDGTSINCTM